MLALGAMALCDAAGRLVPTRHLPHPPGMDAPAASSACLRRQDRQYHWRNNGYRDFDDFLAALSSGRRKTIRRERRDAQVDAGPSTRLTGGRDLTEAHWDAFFDFYMDTGARKWGRPYLNRALLLRLIGERMADRILLLMARRDGRWIAGALNLIGADGLYGRNWGCARGRALPAFRALLLPGHRARHRARPVAGRGRAPRASTRSPAATCPSRSIRPTTSPTRRCAARSRHRPGAARRSRRRWRRFPDAYSPVQAELSARPRPALPSPRGQFQGTRDGRTRRDGADRDHRPWRPAGDRRRLGRHGDRVVRLLPLRLAGRRFITGTSSLGRQRGPLAISSRSAGLRRRLRGAAVRRPGVQAASATCGAARTPSWSPCC